MKNSTKQTKPSAIATTIAKFDDTQVLPSAVSADVTPVWQLDLQEGLEKCDKGYSLAKEGEKIVRKAFGEIKNGRLDMSYDEYVIRREFALTVMRRLPSYKNLNDASMNDAYANIMKNAYDVPVRLLSPISAKPEAVKKAEGREEVKAQAIEMVKEKTPEQLTEIAKEIAVERVAEGLKPEVKKELAQKASAVKEALRIKQEEGRKEKADKRKALLTGIKEFLNDPDTTIEQLEAVQDCIDGL